MVNYLTHPCGGRDRPKIYLRRAAYQCPSRLLTFTLKCLQFIVEMVLQTPLFGRVERKLQADEEMVDVSFEVIQGFRRYDGVKADKAFEYA